MRPSDHNFFLGQLAYLDHLDGQDLLLATSEAPTQVAIVPMIRNMVIAT